ncbi:hypothetical protein G3I35_22030, partial [Streptomyces sp. SID10815]|nr:hypothetical protein [Streptomyces sp. SID10815]
RARGGVGDRRAEVQRTARGRRRGRRRGHRVGVQDAAQVDGTAVAARQLVRARLVDGLDDRLGGGRGHFVAPRAVGAREQQVFVLGGRLGEVGVHAVRGDARLLHHPCALRQPLARDLAGVGHAYPSPIG